MSEEQAGEEIVTASALDVAAQLEELRQQAEEAPAPEAPPLTVESLSKMARNDLRVQELRHPNAYLAKEIENLANMKVLGRVIHLVPTAERPPGPGGRPLDENLIRTIADQAELRVAALIRERVGMELLEDPDGRTHVLPMPSGLQVASNGHRSNPGGHKR
jgi:hypothetical protein